MNGLQPILPTLTLTVWAITMVSDSIPIGTDIGVLTSDDQSGSWDSVPHDPNPSGLLSLPIERCAPHLRRRETTLYAGTSGRGVFKRAHSPANTIGGHPWTLVNAGLTALRAQAVAVASPEAVSTVLAGLVNGGIVKSTDGGANWQSTSESTRTVRGIAVDPADPQTIYAATSRGVIKSTDIGATWTLASAGLPTQVILEFVGGSGTPPVDPFVVPALVRAIAADPVLPGVLYAAVGGVHTSVDGGATWTPLNGNLPSTVTSGAGTVTAFVIDHSPGTDPVWGTIYLGTDGDGVFKSLDGGLSWTSASTGIPTQDRSITALALDPLLLLGELDVVAGTSTGRCTRRSTVRTGSR